MGSSIVAHAPLACLSFALIAWLTADRGTHIGRATRFTGSVFFLLLLAFWVICAIEPSGG